jgi:drug/metabolite transporter (DMT)-like permease
LATLADRAHLPRLFALSMAGTVATCLTLIYGLAKIDAVAGVILLESEPVYSLLLAKVFLGERPSGLQLIATMTILIGIGSVLGTERAFTPLYAAALVFVTPLFWQTSHVLSLHSMPPLTPRCITGARYIYAAIVLVAIALVVDCRALSALADPHVLGLVASTGLFIYFLGSLSWYGAISRLSLAWTTAFVIPGMPILSFLFAMLFLGERPSTREITGITIAIIGVATLVMGADASRKNHTEETAEALHQPIS